MMITIYGLPITIKYQDLKVLIKQECNISDFILDYLVSDGEGGKKVRVGLADDVEGNQLMKCLNGYRLSGHVLKLVPVGKSAPTNSQPQTYTPRSNFARNDYPSQTEHAVKPIETRPTPWSSNPQWTADPVSAVNTYNYQQPQTINTTYVPQAPQAKPQFEARELAITNHSHTTQSYNYPSKSNLISLGPHRNVPTVPVHEISESSIRMQASRYPQSYEAPEKSVTVMKDNFQGSQYSNTQTGSYQSQTLPWTELQQQKPYEKPPVLEKKYDERKYPHVQNKTDITKDTFKYDKPEYARYSDDRRQMSPVRRTSPDRHIDRQSDRMPVRNVDRQPDRPIARPTDRHIDRPTDRYVDRPTDRHIDRPSDRQIERTSDRHMDRQTDRHLDRQTDRHMDRQTDRYMDRQTERHMDRQTERHSSGMQRISPSRPNADRIPGRRLSPDMSRMDRISPPRHTDRRYSPSRKTTQSPIRKMSPHRRMSPLVRKEEYIRGRRVSPPTHSALDRHTSRQSPSRLRHESPLRQSTRYSPRREKPRDYDEHRAVKDVRPAYESQASKEAMYSGGYRPNVHVDVQYQRKDWQDREKQFSSKNIPEDRRDLPRMQKFEIPRSSDPQRITEDEKKRSRSRTSRSPRRSPARDRFRRHSPSPRSPRRSWALEKRRSPECREPPPPPAWPGQDGRQQDYQQQRPKFTDRIEKKTPKWEVSSQEKKCDDFNKVDRRNFEDQRVHTDVSKWKPLPQASPKETSRFVDADRFQKESKYSRKEFEGRHVLSRGDDDHKSYPERRDKNYTRSEREEPRYKPNTHKDMIVKKQQEYSGTIEEKKKEILHKQELLQKEIDEVYKRAVDFTKKAELYKKSDLKKDFQYKDDHRHDDKEYEERLKYSHEDDRRGREDYRKEFSKPYPKADESKFGNFGKSRDSEDFERKFGANAAIKIKRIKAMDEISEKILNQYASDKSSEIKKRISEELKLSIGKILVDMFGDKDVSFIEMLVKFNARHTQKDEERIFEDVMSCLPTHYRTIKRPSKGDSGISAKVSRRSAEPNLNKDQQPIVNKQMNRQNKREALKVQSNEVAVKKRPVEAPKLEDEKKGKIVKITKQTKTKPAAQVVKASDQDIETMKQEIKTPKEELKNNKQEEDKVQEEEKFQLSQLMTHVLEEELQDVMIQIWKTLPDVATSDAERFVTERLRDDASDNIKKVLGLNVTKRLLNVSNPLFVKIQFSGRPENGYLTKFLQAYNIISFKRINQDSNTFAAKLDTITDFDNICTAKDLRCGSAQLTVTPFYKFTKCPDNLKTVYANKTLYELGADNENTTKINSKNNLNVEDNSLVKVTAEVTPDKIEETTNKTKPEEKLTTVTKIQNKQKAQVNTKPVKNEIKTDKKVEHKFRMKEIQYENEIFEEINEMDPDFNEEMNDDEILALISGGVVVDQCSGSDQE